MLEVKQIEKYSEVLDRVYGQLLLKPIDRKSGKPTIIFYLIDRHGMKRLLFNQKNQELIVLDYDYHKILKILQITYKEFVILIRAWISAKFNLKIASIQIYPTI